MELDYEFIPPVREFEPELHLRQNIDDLIKAVDLQNIINFLSHNGEFDGVLLRAEGRNAVLELSGKEESFFDAVQISGGAYIPVGLEGNQDAEFGVHIFERDGPVEVHVPAQRDKLFTHHYSVAQQGLVMSKCDTSPLGSNNELVANRKIEGTVRASYIDNEEFIIPPIVLGKQLFKGLSDGEGGVPTAILFSVPAGGLRADSAYAVPLINTAMFMPDRISEAIERIVPHMMTVMYGIGKAAAIIHSHGMVHRQLTLGNVLPLGDINSLSMYVADWETIGETGSEKFELPQALELVVAARSFTGLFERLFRIDEIINPLVGSQICLEGIASLVVGYTRAPYLDVMQSIDLQASKWMDALSVINDPGPSIKEYLPLINLVRDFQD